MEFSAIAKYVKMGPRKVQLVARSIHRLTAAGALVKLGQLPKRVARPLADVLASAIAGAKEKKADTTLLRIKSIEVLPGPAMKRWHAVSKGQAHAFKKRMTHIRVTLTDEVGKHQAPKAKHQTIAKQQTETNKN
ncbi:MAG: uL22 family ribosomal protein [Candidatus Gottesmanbacteria bacterium]|nr:uL22 family ribosomal protein [Candidatus Gottesmanbacteria bacterium]